MKKYLIDVPVKINIWIRPECQKKQFEVIKEAKPSILFIISDGGRNDKEQKIIRENRKYIEDNIDWNCTVYKQYEEQNQGMYTMITKMHQLIWSHVDRCIFLEDDILPTVDFFKYCAELLERYKNDFRISHICGMNHLGINERADADYFFSREGSIWGVALWKRTYEMYYKFDYANSQYTMELLRENLEKNKVFWKRVSAYSKEPVYEGHVAGDEFFLEFNMYGYNQLQIVPKKNMISNIGCTKESAHADELSELPPNIRRLFNARVYSIEFPLKHPVYIIPDLTYERKRNKTLGYNCPFIELKMKLWKFFHMIKKGQFGKLINLIYKKIRGEVLFER